jgi:hypothetical protein
MSTSETNTKRIIPPNESFDVYFGSGNKIAKIVGTINYRKKVKELQSSYKQLKTHKQKNEKAMEIVDAFEGNGGKFYSYNKDTKCWEVTPHDKKLRTIKQALREDPKKKKAATDVNTNETDDDAMSIDYMLRLSIRSFVVPDDLESISENFEESESISFEEDLNKSTDLFQLSDLSLDRDLRFRILNEVY